MPYNGFRRGYAKYPYKFAARRYSTRKRFDPIKLAKDVAVLQSLINVEKKFIDTTATYAMDTASSATQTLTLLNGLAQGDGSTNRDGNSIKMTSLEVDGYVSLNSLQTNDYIRVAIVMDMQANAAAPVFTDIYESSVPVSLAKRNKNTVDRFIVLKEWDFTLTTAGKAIQKFEAFKKMQQHVKFNGTGATIASLYTGAIYLVANGSVGSNTSSITFNSRIRFVDN